jgi:predicted metal-binding membrane protein
MPTRTEAPLAARGNAERDLALAVLLAGLSMLAWGALWAWSASPYARYAEHGNWLDSSAFAALCRALPGGMLFGPAVLYALAWVLMIAAMMLPTTYPVLGIFRVSTRSRADGRRLLALVLAGFFCAWFLFGLLAHALDGAVAWLGGRNGWLLEHGWAAGALVLAAAGLFQFSALKYRCLEQCRTPFAFVASRWRGRSPAREAFGIGLDHGVFCVGCCWALMLCMFVVGTGSLGWMLALGALMAVEKNLPGGARLRAPIGLGLLGAAGLIVLEHAWPAG